MQQEAAERWNERYAQDGERWLQQQPRRLLLEFAPLLPVRGLALDAAGGVSVHGAFLARRGMRVITLDISRVGLQLAQQHAAAAQLPLQTAVADLAAPLPLPAAGLDLIVNFRFLERSTFADYRRVLKSGGWLVFETFVKADKKTDHPYYYLEPGELHTAFADFRIIHSEEKQLIGRSGTPKLAAQLVAQKP